MLEIAMKDPIDLKMLKINGHVLMNECKIAGGPRMSLILKAIMGEVLENPDLNTEKYLQNRAIELDKLDLKTLKGLAKRGEEEVEEKEASEEADINKKFRVR
jgi:hypothetical protein